MHMHAHTCTCTCTCSRNPCKCTNANASFARREYVECSAMGERSSAAALAGKNGRFYGKHNTVCKK